MKDHPSPPFQWWKIWLKGEFITDSGGGVILFLIFFCRRLYLQGLGTSSRRKRKILVCGDRRPLRSSRVTQRTLCVTKTIHAKDDVNMSTEKWSNSPISFPESLFLQQWTNQNQYTEPGGGGHDSQSVPGEIFTRFWWWKISQITYPY